MKITIKTIPHKDQRYETCGDYWTDDNGDKHIVVSEMGNDNYALLVAIHELAEMWLTEKRGITEESITTFDKIFEDSRLEGDKSEPGDSRDAPYDNEHCYATAIERMMCAALGEQWEDYEDAVNRLFENQDKVSQGLE